METRIPYSLRKNTVCHKTVEQIWLDSLSTHTILMTFDLFTYNYARPLYPLLHASYSQYVAIYFKSHTPSEPLYLSIISVAIGTDLFEALFSTDVKSMK